MKIATSRLTEHEQQISKLSGEIFDTIQPQIDSIISKLESYSDVTQFLHGLSTLIEIQVMLRWGVKTDLSYPIIEDKCSGVQ